MNPKDGLWPFNIVDLFAYLGQGLFAIVVVSELRSSHLSSLSIGALSEVTKNQPTWVTVPLGVLLAYMLGHIIAHCAHPLIELVLVPRVLGRPLDRLRGKTADDAPIKRTLISIMGAGSYRNRWPSDLIAELDRCYSGEFPNRQLVDHYSLRTAFIAVNERAPATSARIATFLGLYTFCRNTSFTLLTLGLFAVVVGGRQEALLLVVFLVASGVLFGRYLTFLRLYTDEILLGFLVSSPIRQVGTNKNGSW